MSCTKFAVEELILLRSRDYPELNGEYTIVEVYTGYYDYPGPDTEVYGTLYVLDSSLGDWWWYEAALRKHPGYDEKFE